LNSGAILIFFAWQHFFFIFLQLKISKKCDNIQFKMLPCE
jgi:hypothetical protein